MKSLPFKLPSMIVLLLWSIVPLGMTLWFSFQRYNLLNPGEKGFVWFENDRFLVTDPGLRVAILNTLLLVVWVLVITVGLGTVLAMLFNQAFFGRGMARVLAIAPFFVMPTVSALIWKNLLMHPVNGIISFLMRSVGLQPIDWFSNAPLTAIIIIVAWQWLPFALLILLAAFQSLDPEQKEAARMDGAGLKHELYYLLLPLSLPGIAPTSLLAIILAWNEAFWSLNLTGANTAPLTAFIASFSSPEGLFWAKLSAASSMAVAPILVFGWMSQRQLVRGLTFGAVK